MATSPVSINPAAVQGLVMHVYLLPAARHHFFRFEGAPAEARAFLRRLLPRVTTGATYSRDAPALNVGLSFAGIRALDVLGAEALDAFPRDFQEPPSPEQFG